MSDRYNTRSLRLGQFCQIFLRNGDAYHKFNDIDTEMFVYHGTQT
jgi:hypothetical protein